MNKYMSHVLCYINEEESMIDNCLFNTKDFKMPAFDKIHFLTNEGKEAIVKSIYPEGALRNACVSHYVHHFKPKLTEEKFSEINPAKLWTFLTYMPKKFHGEENEDISAAITLRNCLSHFKKEEIKVLTELYKVYPRLLEWKKSNFSKDLKLGEKSDFTTEDANDFAKRCNKTRMGHRFHHMNPAMTSKPGWEDRLDNFYYEASDSQWRTRKCTACGKKDWTSQVPTFFKIDADCSDCGARCSDCLLEIVKENYSSKSSATFTGPKGGCYLNVIEIKGVEFFAKNLEISESECTKIAVQDYEALVMTNLRNLPQKITTTPEKLGLHQGLFDRCNAVRSKSFMDETLLSEYDSLQVQIANLLKMTRLKTKLEKLDSQVDKLVQKTKAGNDEEMLDQCKNLLDPIRQVLADRPEKKDTMPDIFGMTMEDIMHMKLQRAKDALTTAYSIARTCSICMTTSNRSEEELLQLHGELEKDVTEWKWDSRRGRAHGSRSMFRLPCHSCKDCFSNYLSFKSALGKPALRCPGMNCECHLKKADLKILAPVAYADYEAAMMRYSLKKVNNFRTCPNADCSAGLVIDVDCKAERITCTACDFSFCPHCNDVPHEGMSCEDMRRQRHKERWGNEKEFMANETKQCPHCLVWIEKNGGCNHMTCHHCRGEFCWLCFGEWHTHVSCEEKKEVTRRPFKELFPDWTQKPKKTLKPRFSPGKYVEYKEESGHSQAIARVSEVDIHGMYITYLVEPIDGSEALCIEESLLRGYNKPVSSIDLEKSDAMEAETYASYLSGFDEYAKSQPDPTTNDISPYESFLSGFKSDDEDEFKAKLTRHSEYILKQSLESCSSLKKQMKARAIRELKRESKICNDDEEESSAECPQRLWDSDYEGEEESSACLPEGFWGWENVEWEGEEDSEIIAPIAFLAALYDSECESDSLDEDDLEEESSHGPGFFGLFDGDSDSGTNSGEEFEDKKFDYGFSSDEEEESS